MLDCMNSAQLALQPPPIPKRPGVSSSDATIEVTNVLDGEIVHQRILLVDGRAGIRNAQFEAPIQVSCNGFPTTTWPCVNSHFKSLVHLVPGPNTITFVFQTEVLHFHVQYVPLLQNPPLFLCIFIAKDSPGTFDVPPEKQDENGLEVAVEKLRMAGYLWQAFCAEQMHRNGMGRRTFRLDESYQLDSISGEPDTARETAQVHIIRSKHKLKEIRDWRRAQQSPNRDDNLPSLHALFQEDLASHPRFGKQPYVVAGLILDSHWDVSKNTVLGHAALGAAGEHALGIFGSHLIHAWPRNIHDVVPSMLNTTPTDTRYVANDANESGEWWRALNIGMGAMLHEVGHAFTLPHTASGIMSRGYNNWNRTFMAKEPGMAPISPEEEAGSHWHRVDIVRLRFHPAFALPSDPVVPANDLNPTLMPRYVEEIEVTAPAGLSMIELSVNGRYRTHIEYLDQHPTEMVVAVAQMRQHCHCKPEDRLRLEVTTVKQQTEAIDDVDQFIRDHIVWVPGISGSVMKSNGFGRRGLNGTEATVAFMNYYLVSVRVHHGSFLDGIVFRLSDNSETLIGKRGGRYTDFYLQPGERLASLVVRTGAWVDGIQFRTSNGRISQWFGGHGGGLQVIAPPKGHIICGMYGSAASWMDQVGIFSRLPDLSPPA